MGVHDEHLGLAAARIDGEGQPPGNSVRHLRGGKTGAVFDGARPAGDVKAALALLVVLGHNLPGVFRPGLGLGSGLRHRLLAGGGRRLGCGSLFRRGARSHRSGSRLRGWRGLGSGRLGRRVLPGQLTHRLQCRRRVHQGSARHRKACGHAGRAHLLSGVPCQYPHTRRQRSRAQPAQPARSDHAAAPFPF